MKSKWIPVVIEELCTGCGLCLEACGPACLEVENQVAVLPRPDDCGSEGHCITACPEDAIHLSWVPMVGHEKRGIWQEFEDPESKPQPVSKFRSPS